MIEFGALGLIAPDAGTIGVIEEGGPSFAEPTSRAIPATPGNHILRHPLSEADALTRFLAISHLNELRRGGATLILISHDESLLEQCADEIWWLRDGRLIARGHPAEILPLYRTHIARLLRAAGTDHAAQLAPTARTGDGRASVEGIELLGEGDRPSTIWRSGEGVAVVVHVRYLAEVAEPVIGILIRTRIGLNVYGTNTELEKIHPGPVVLGESLTVTFRFACDLCPGDYTVTAASHDPDGLWHDWQEDAVSFAVSDSRYTAGVANLRAQVYCQSART